MSKKIIFLHIPRTAGTSLRRIVEQEYPAGNCVCIYSHAPEFLASIRKDVSRAEVIYGHISYGIHRFLGVQGRYIAFVRNPIDRVISHCSHIVRHKQWGDYGLEEGTSLLHILENELCPQIMNNLMVRIISGYGDRKTIDDTAVLDKAMANIDAHFEFVGLAECMSESVSILGRRLNWKTVYQVPVLNVNPDAQLPEVDEKTLAAVKKYNRLDIMLYERVKDTFTTCLQEYTDTFGVIEGTDVDFRGFPNRLNLGCGFDIREGYLNIDLNAFHRPDLVADVRDLQMLPSGYYEEIIAQDVLEHIPRRDTKSTFIEWNRLLGFGGTLRLRVPSLSGLMSLFAQKENQTIEKQEQLIQCLFGTQAYDGDSHHTVFTEMLLRHYLSVAGFRILDVSVKDKWLFDVIAQKIDFRELANISDDRKFLFRAYTDILGREPDKGGLDYYLSKLEDGEMTKELVIDILLDSKERKRLSGS